MRNIRMIISYDGTSYNGFQSQPNGNTIQDRLEHALSRLTGEPVKIIGSGRTDAGVHARKQVVNFSTSSRIPTEKWTKALNSLLPEDILAVYADEVPEYFHARKCAKMKTYRYTIRNSCYPDIFRRHFEYHHYTPLDHAAMRRALAYLVGTHDFTSLCSARSTQESHVRTLFRAELTAVPIMDDPIREGTLITIDLTGNGFLYNMVRIIVGTLIQIGEGKRTSESMGLILAGKDRSLAGPTAMAHGLTLWDIKYDEIGDIT